MTYSDWREDLSEGAKTRLVVKGLKAIKSVIKKGGKKIKGEIGNIGATKAGSRLKMDDVVNRPVKPKKPTLKKGESWTGGGTRDGKPIPTRNLSARYKTYINKLKKYEKDIKDFNDKLIKDRKDVVDPSKIGDNPGARAKIRDLLNKLKKNVKEEAMAAPTNSVGDGSNVALPPTHEPGIKKKKNKRGSGMKNRKKKTYAYGGYGSRKNWMV